MKAITPSIAQEKKSPLYDLSQTFSYPVGILRSERKGVTIMESIALATEFIGSVAYLGSVALLAFVASGVLFGYMAEEEKSGKRLYWAEWPIPEAEESVVEEFRMAA